MNKKIFTLFAFLIGVVVWGVAQTTDTTYTASGTFVVPAGVTSITTIQAWGGGGAGGAGAGNGANTRSGGGGGGGAYSTISSLSATPGQTYSVNVGNGGATSGASGGASTVIRIADMATVLSASGGGGGGAASGPPSPNNGSSGTGGTGGTYSGGAGATGVNDNGGGGGGSGGTGSIGNNGGNGTPPNGAAAVTGGGGGGSGGTAAGASGGFPGGGGGGGRGNGGAGGAGNNGQVIITYNCPTYIVDYITSSLAGNIATIVVNGSLLSDGTYTANYSFSGSATDGSGVKTFTITGGTGSFQTDAISNITPTTTVTVNTLSSGTTCTSTVTATAALPVTWLSFRAALEGDDVKLHWSTASESNNEGFDVQRSENGREWQTIAFVPGAGTTSEVQNYSYTDSSPFTLHPSLYYRLEQRDYDGTTDYSPVRVVELGAAGGIRLYPNPADEEVTVAFAEPIETRGYIQLYTQNRRFITEYPLAPQTQEFSFRVASLPAGTYIVVVKAGAQEWTRRLVVE